MFLQASVSQCADWRGKDQLTTSGWGDPCFKVSRWKRVRLYKHAHINFISSPGLQGLHPQCFQGYQHLWLLSCLWWPSCLCWEAGRFPWHWPPSQRRGFVPDTMLTGSGHQRVSQWFHYHYFPPGVTPPQFPHHYHTTGWSPREPSRSCCSHGGRPHSAPTNQLPKTVPGL